ncbi:MAG: SGNH family hydrolase [Castellaniella sp.]|uniref:SGNH/GDSL hydrolase family protein n=1 Tax=Castellaniella sp. TaxID=1955812 RepID=UPI003C7790AE
MQASEAFGPPLPPGGLDVGEPAAASAPEPHPQHPAPLGRALAVLLLCALPLAWLMQDSIRLYWQQTYHSPLAPADTSAADAADLRTALLAAWWTAWRIGGHWQTAWDTWRADRAQDLSRFDDKAIATLNQIWIAPPPVLPEPASADQPAPAAPGKPAPVSSNKATSASSSKATSAAPNKAASASSRQSVSASRSRPATAVAAPEPVIDPLPPQDAAGRITLTAGDQVFFVGDSMMQGVAPHVRRALLKKHGIDSIDLSKQSTGLSYQGFFNWPATVEKAFEQHPHIALMVVFLGPNDPWDFPVKKGETYLRFRSEQWETVYRERIRLLLSTAAKHHARVLWVGAPPMKREVLDKGMRYLNTLYQAEVEQGGGQFIPGHLALGYPDTDFSFHALVEDKKTKVRIDDGVHFTLKGQRLIAQAILAHIDAPTLEPQPAPAPRPAGSVAAQTGQTRP